ncbi:VCBS repeat-containing protein [Chloroflexi bacterium TSY]|nr:VCBS repeat-containing protein [Chloroflexi bacterium TSY]
MFLLTGCVFVIEPELSTSETGGQSASPASSKHSSAPPDSLRFQNVAQEIGLDFQHGAFQVKLSEDPGAAMAGGLCWLDYNNDGWLDLYLVNSHAKNEVGYWKSKDGLPHNALFRNEQGHFVDVSVETQTDLAMRGNGCVAADFNLDGWTDIFITTMEANALLWNNGDGIFEENAAGAGLDAVGWCSGWRSES